MMTSTTAPPPPLMAILLALTLVILGLESAEPPPSPPPSCADELVRFSPCLPYVSSPPNNLSDSPPPKCCDAFSLSMQSGGALCFCYLVQDPPMLGFPVNGSRVLSLSSTCPLRDISTNASAQSLESLCSGSPELPPLRSSTISEISSPPPSGFESVDNASSPLMSLAPEPANNSSIPRGNRSPTPPSSALEPARISAAMKQVYLSKSWILRAIASFLVQIFI